MHPSDPAFIFLTFFAVTFIFNHTPAGCMAELKTKRNHASVRKYLAGIESEEQREDCRQLVRLFTEASGEKAAMWGTNIVGFGSYHYKSERSSQEGDWPLTGFSPRKRYIASYIMPGVLNYKNYLKNLGRHKTSSGSCLYIKRLSDVSVPVLKKIVRDSVKDMRKKFGK